LASKVYNITGHAFFAWKKFGKAYHYFKKLRDVSRMGGDLETTMYAFKQIGFALNQDREHEKALKAFKCQLQMAWHLRHTLGELSSYE